MNSLAAYASSDDDDTQINGESTKRKASSTTELTVAPPPPKKLKLPSLPLSLTPPVPEFDPSKHQGGIRTQPHVEGQFASYVYVPVSLERSVGGGISRLVNRALKHAKGVVPSIQHIIDERKPHGTDDDEDELHVSLSRPVYLRHHQREAFKSAVRAIACSHAPFSASFATFATFNNDERTRVFLALEVGAGHKEFHDLARALTPTLRSLYQKEYYSQPRFHASIAWALLDSPLGAQPPPVLEAPSDVDVLPQTTLRQDSADFSTISELPTALLTGLTGELGERLRQRAVFDVTEVRVRIGKEVKAYPLRSR